MTRPDQGLSLSDGKKREERPWERGWWNPTARESVPSLCRLFNLSLSLGTVPSNWKRANVMPVFKKDDVSLASNYRPISLPCTVSKVLERWVFNHSCQHLSPYFYNLQHGFLKGRSTVTLLLQVYHDMLDSLASGKEIDCIYLDLSKAFDRVPHHLLVNKLERYGIPGSLLQWFLSYLSARYQRVVLEGTCPDVAPSVLRRPPRLNTGAHAILSIC